MRRYVWVAAALVVAAGLPLAWRGDGTTTPPAVESADASPAVALQHQHPGPYDVAITALPPAEALRPKTTRLLVLGDSVGVFLGTAMRHRQDEEGVFVAERSVGSCSVFAPGFRATSGDSPVETSCARDWERDVRELRPQLTLIVLGGAYLGEHACKASWLSAYEARLAELFETMKQRTRLVLALPPYPVGPWRRPVVMERVDCFNRMLTRTARRQAVATLDLMGFVCPTSECQLLSQGKPIRPDGLHFDGGGAEETARFAIRQLLRLQSVPTVPTVPTVQ